EKKPTSSFHNNTKPLGIPRGHTPLVTNSGNNKSSFASILKEGKVRDASAIPNLYIILLKEGFQFVKLRYLRSLWVLIESDSLDSVEKFQNHVGVGSWFSLIKLACNSFVSDERIVWISVEGLPINSWTRNMFSKFASKWGDLVVWDESDVMTLSCKHLCLKTKINIIINECFKIIIKGKIHWLRAKELDAWVPTFLFKEECDSTEDGESDDFGKGRNFGDMEFDNSNSNAESDVEKVSESSCMRETNFAQVKIPITSREDTPQSTDPFNIYDFLQKKKVVTPQPNESDPTYPPYLFDLPMGGYSYTWSHKSATKMSKLDRFLISKGLMVPFPHLSRLCLERHLSDHRPIIMFESSFDYGPTPFRMFHSWFLMEGFDKFVENLWHSMNITDSNGLIRMKKKLHIFKNAIKTWVKENKTKINDFKSSIQNKLSEVENPLIKVAKTKKSSINDPPKVKTEFLNHFSNQFLKPSSLWIKIDSEFPTQLNSNQVEDLERPISQEEIKKAVWDCVIHDFFSSGTFPPDILATRLSLVMSDLISDMQTTFVSSRQILDGPFIVNEFLSWCKHKKINAMIFKVDFEKAFDSVRWDYLDDILKSFGFRIKWRSWISGCLDSSMGPVLVNGSPTPEMISSGLFKCVNINNSLTLSHLFYTDDVIFVGKWDINNIKTIVNVLKYFFLASGLKINLHKTKLTGTGVNKDDVDSTATLVGCSTFYPPFHYLEKLKTLSIGGRLTLLKSVLTAIPIYHMSLYKVPVGILNDMESIRKNFFNGIEKSERKNGMDSLGNYFGFKEKWRVRSFQLLLYKPFIQAMHGVRGVIDNKNSSIKGSIWIDIVWDISSLNHKCIDLLAAAKRKLGNGENTLFWEDKWIGEGIEDKQYIDLRTTTSNILLPNMHDRWFWSLNSTGEFSVSLVRNYIDEFLLPKASTSTRWIKLVPIKLNITAWRICLDKLPTSLLVNSWRKFVDGGS
nr:RNA-directed DNA polymerase, eukaryota [Tanacetum cinerariifolium]